MDTTLLPRLRRWSASSWTDARAATAAGVVQRLADLGADAEGRPRLAVPDLGPAVLADQLAVMFDDVARTGDPAALRRATEELAALRTALGL